MSKSASFATAAQPTEPPERIFGWLDTQLSLARHYGGLTYQGRSYFIDYHAEGHPLVRDDVIKREVAALKKAKAKAWHDAKVAARESAQNQGGLL